MATADTTHTVPQLAPFIVSDDENNVLGGREALEHDPVLYVNTAARADLILGTALARLERVKSALYVLAASGSPEVIFEPSQLAGFLSPQVEEVLALLEALNVKLHSSPAIGA
jgi:hypothetical protein